MKKISLKNRKGQNIFADLEFPKGEIRGTCVVQHGWGGHRNKSTVQATKNAFLESGFQTFNFDTTNSFGESDGDYEKSTLGLHWEDLEDVVQWAQKQDWFVGPLALTGHSKGGYSVVRYAEEHPKEVSYLVPIAPVISGEFSFQAHRKYKPEELKKWKREGVISSIGREGHVKVNHWFQMLERLNHDLLPKASSLEMPTLIIVGSEDESCPLIHQEMLLGAMSSSVDKSIFVIPNAPHSFYKEEEQAICKQAIKDWLIARIS